MNSMLKNFGGDPFASDPFFKEPFGSMDKMISKMRTDMKRAMDEPFELMGPLESGKGRFAHMQSITSSKQDEYGNPVRVTYHSKAHGAFGNGQKVTERH